MKAVYYFNYLSNQCIFTTLDLKNKSRWNNGVWVWTNNNGMQKIHNFMRQESLNQSRQSAANVCHKIKVRYHGIAALFGWN